MNICKKYTVFLCFSAFFMLSACTTQKGFDEICLIYTEARSMQAGKEELSKYIFDNISSRVNVPEAIEAHVVIFHVSPDERYPIFKEGAEDFLKHNWECDAMKELMHSNSNT